MQVRKIFFIASLGQKLSRLEKILRTCAERYLIIQLCQKSKYKCQSVHKIDFKFTVSLNFYALLRMYKMVFKHYY